MPTDQPFTAADVERLVQSAVDQGLPRHVEDPETCRKIAVLLTAPFEGGSDQA